MRTLSTTKKLAAQPYVVPVDTSREPIISLIINAQPNSALRVEHLDTAPDDFLAHDPEDSRFHRGFQAANVEPGFTFGYYAVYRGSQRVSVVPYFIMDFHVNTMLPEGFLKRSLSWIKFKIACVGHPSSDLGHIHGEVTADILEAVNQELAKKAKIIAYKGFGADFPLAGFVKAKGLPVALLRIKGDYWSQLRCKARYKMKEKLEQLQYLRHEECDQLSREQAEKIYALYLNTYARAEVKLERLNIEYFLETAPVSKYLLFYEGEHLIGFCQLFCKKPRITMRYCGLDYERSTKYGTYFLFSLQAIQLCLRDGYTELETGATSYTFKKAFGSDLIPTWVYYRHSNPIAHWILGKVKFVLEPSTTELL